MKKGNDVRSMYDMMQDALTMYRLYDERYWILMMTWVPHDERRTLLVDEAKKQADYWLARYEKFSNYRKR